MGLRPAGLASEKETQLLVREQNHAQHASISLDPNTDDAGGLRNKQVPFTTKLYTHLTQDKSSTGIHTEVGPLGHKECIFQKGCANLPTRPGSVCEFQVLCKHII